MTVTEPIPASVRLEDVPCPLCDSSESEFVLEGFDRLHQLPGRFRIVRCNGCGLMRTNPRPTRETIGYYYPDDYGPYEATRVERNEPDAVRRGWKPVVRRMMDTRSMAVPSLPAGRMLEVGCASGAFLARMERQGWTVEGIEFSPAAAKSARDAGLEVFAGSIDDAPLSGREFDLIVGWMVIEHLHDPVAALKRLRQSAKRDAYLVISVPNSASVDFKLLGSADYALHLPAHLFHFTPATIRAVLAAAGWRVERVLHQRNIENLVAGTGYKISDRFDGSRIGEALQRFPANGRAQDVLFPLAFVLSLIGQTGRMTIWARPA